MSNLIKRLDTHFVACAAAAGAAVVGGVQQSEAAVVYSGIVNIPIPNDFYGVYLNVQTGAFQANGAPVALAGWDLNPYQGGGSLFQNTTAPEASAYVGSPATNLAPGTPINAAAGLSPATTNFAVGVEGILGFKFVDAGNVSHFGWMHYTKNAGGAGTAGVIRDYAWENTAGGAINAGDIPAPGSLALLAVGAIGVAGRRRK